MKPPDLGYHRTKDGRSVFGAEMDLSSIEPWEPTITKVRDAVLSWFVTAADLSAIPKMEEAARYMPTQDEVERISTACRDAVTYGRMIDFGNLPNEVIKQGSSRGGPMYNRGLIGHPFRQPWVLYHTWEEGPAIYLVQLIDPSDPVGDCEIAELNPVVISGHPMLLIGDRGLMMQQMDKPDEYRLIPAPSPFRFIPGVREEMLRRDPRSENQQAAGNVLDPVMTALLILNTRNIGRETIHAPAKLNRARIRNRKPPIPPYDAVDSQPYVTAVLRRGQRREPDPLRPIGHHASPEPHLRMGHVRTYASGVQTFVRDTLVNVSSEARAAFLHRSHYEVKR